MADSVDRASECEAHQRADALARHAAHSPLHGKTVADSADECCECGDAIPPRRRHALPGVQTCVDCQAALERAAKTRRAP